MVLIPAARFSSLSASLSRFVARYSAARFSRLAEFSLVLNATTNYLYRGFSKSDNQPTIQLNLDYEHDSGIFLGTWTSLVDFGDDPFDNPARVEISPYIGWTARPYLDWRFETYYTHYFYAGKIFGRSADYDEFSWALHFRDWFSVVLAWSPNIYGQPQAALTYEGSVRYPVTETLEFFTGLGYSQVRDALKSDYLYWNSGLSWFVHRNISLALSYVQSTRFKSNPRENRPRNPEPVGPAAVGPPAVFSISLGF